MMTETYSMVVMYTLTRSYKHNVHTTLSTFKVQAGIMIVVIEINTAFLKGP